MKMASELRQEIATMEAERAERLTHEYESYTDVQDRQLRGKLRVARMELQLAEADGMWECEVLRFTDNGNRASVKLMIKKSAFWIVKDDIDETHFIGCNTSEAKLEEMEIIRVKECVPAHVVTWVDDGLNVMAMIVQNDRIAYSKY